MLAERCPPGSSSEAMAPAATIRWRCRLKTPGFPNRASSTGLWVSGATHARPQASSTGSAFQSSSSISDGVRFCPVQHRPTPSQRARWGATEMVARHMKARAPQQQLFSLGRRLVITQISRLLMVWLYHKGCYAQRRRAHAERVVRFQQEAVALTPGVRLDTVKSSIHLTWNPVGRGLDGID